MDPSSHVETAPAESAAAAPRPVAVIDIGTTSVRMTVAEIASDGEIRPLEELSQPARLGRDTFGQGYLGKETVRDVVRILEEYRRVIREYGIDDPAQIRSVATSAVSEATNRMTLLDRIEIATGFRVEVIDPAEVSRLTYLGILPLLKKTPELALGRVLVLKIGGGGAEALLLEETNVVQTLVFRQGSLRLRKTLEAKDAPAPKVRAALRRDIRRFSDRVLHLVQDPSGISLFALGSDIRLVAETIHPQWDRRQIQTLEAHELERFAETVLPIPLEELARRFRRSFSEIRTLTPALLAWVELSEHFGSSTIHAVGNTMRDGILREMAVGSGWTEEFGPQILHSAVQLGRSFGFGEAHGLHTAELASKIFHALQDEHGLGSRYELLLKVAAVLHDIGNSINNRAHHKHSMYMILNADLFGLGSADLLLVGLIARYHRRATPRPTHEGYLTLGHADRLVLAKLAAILRIADALDRSESQRIGDIRCESEGERFVIYVPGIQDLFLEQLAIRQKGSLFEDTYGMQVHLRTD